MLILDSETESCVYDSSATEPHDLAITGDVVVIGDDGVKVKVDKRMFFQIGVFWGIYLAAYVDEQADAARVEAEL